MTVAARWHLVTPEFPPRVGGVADHTLQIARGLVGAGDEVHVWCPGPAGEEVVEPGLTLHREPGAFSPSALGRLTRAIGQPAPGTRLLVQWVPHAYGYRSMNLALPAWVVGRARAGHRVDVMVHEPGLPFSATRWRWNVPAVVHRVMAAMLSSAADRVWFSAPDWADRWRRYAPRRAQLGWLPLPNGIPVIDDPAEVARVRATALGEGSGTLLGHFGLAQFGVVEPLAEWAAAALRDGSRRLVLIGQGGGDARDRIARAHPEIADRLRATGPLPARDVSLWLQACDLLLQPFAGGVNARRSSVVAGIAHRRALVTTDGPFTEPFWRGGGVALVPDGDPAAAAARIQGLLAEPEARRALAEDGAALYRQRFAVRHAITALRTGRPSEVGVSSGVSFT